MLHYKTETFCNDITCDYCKQPIIYNAYALKLSYELEDYHKGDISIMTDTYELCSTCKDKLLTTLEVTQNIKSISHIFNKEKYIDYRFHKMNITSYETLVPNYKIEIEKEYEVVTGL